jgi:hypothetical protein
MDNQILSDEPLLRQTYVQDGVDHDLDSADGAAHIWLLLAECQNHLDGLFPQLLILRVFGDARDGLAKQVGEGRRVLLQPSFNQFETLESLLDNLGMLIFSL